VAGWDADLEAAQKSHQAMHDLVLISESGFIPAQTLLAWLYFVRNFQTNYVIIL
jgi:hypothetical protein